MMVEDCDALHELSFYGNNQPLIQGTDHLNYCFVDVLSTRIGKCEDSGYDLSWIFFSSFLDVKVVTGLFCIKFEQIFGEGFLLFALKMIIIPGFMTHCF